MRCLAVLSPKQRRTSEAITGAENRTWEYTAGDLSQKKIRVSWEYRYPGEEVLARWENPRRTGFNISWYVRNQNGNQIAKNQAVADNNGWRPTTNQIPKYPEETRSFTALVNAAQRALDVQIDHSMMIDGKYYINQEQH